MQKAVSYWDQKDPSYSDMIGGSLGIDSDIDVRAGPGKGGTARHYVRAGLFRFSHCHACMNRSHSPADLLVFLFLPFRSETAGSY